MNGFGGWKPPGKPSTLPIRDFIERYKQLLKLNGLDLWTTLKNNEFMEEHGFTLAEVECVIGTLEHKHYSKGPCEDDDPKRPPGEVWMFNVEYGGIPAYLKLKIVTNANGHPAVCMSFHDPKHEMKTPLKAAPRTISSGRMGKRR